MEMRKDAIKVQTVKADRMLFQRLLVAKDAGRNVDLPRPLCNELSLVPLALADTSEHLHQTNKYELAKILHESSSF